MFLLHTISRVPSFYDFENISSFHSTPFRHYVKRILLISLLQMKANLLLIVSAMRGVQEERSGESLSRVRQLWHQGWLSDALRWKNAHRSVRREPPEKY